MFLVTVTISGSYVVATRRFDTLAQAKTFARRVSLLGYITVV